MSGAGTREAPVTLPSISVIVPAFNEERCIAQTLDHLRAAGELLRTHTDRPVQILLVDNASIDRTAAIARDRGVTVIGEAEHKIAKVRNAGARAAGHDVLVFVDAETLVPGQTLRRIGQVMASPACLGGAVDNTYDAQRPVIRSYYAPQQARRRIPPSQSASGLAARHQLHMNLDDGEIGNLVWRMQ